MSKYLSASLFLGHQINSGLEESSVQRTIAGSKATMLGPERFCGIQMYRIFAVAQNGVHHVDEP